MVAKEFVAIPGGATVGLKVGAMRAPTFFVNRLFAYPLPASAAHTARSSAFLRAAKASGSPIV
jgi:hypothetical protein